MSQLRFFLLVETVNSLFFNQKIDSLPTTRQCQLLQAFRQLRRWVEIVVHRHPGMGRGGWAGQEGFHSTQARSQDRNPDPLEQGLGRRQPIRELERDHPAEPAEPAAGALVAGVVKKSPAETAGFKTGDVIITFDGRRVPESRKLPLMVAETDVGKKVRVVVWRNGKKEMLSVQLGELEKVDQASLTAPGGPDTKGKAGGQQFKELGLTLAPLSKDLAKRFEIEEQADGVVVTDANVRFFMSDAQNVQNHPVATRDCPLSKRPNSRLGCIFLLSCAS